MIICGKSLSKGEKRWIQLSVTTLPDSSVLSIPIGVARGSEDGPILCVTSGVHGDEYEGPWAIADVFKELNPRSMKGTFIGIPVVNVLAYPYGSRTTPLDQKDLARFFPGNKNGTVSEQIAYKITEEIIKKSDYVIDLHSGGTDYRYLDMVCYFDVPGNLGEKSFNLAHTFPVKVIFRSEEKPIGRLIDAAIEVGVPSIGTECSGEGRYNEKKKNIYVSGIKNALRYLGIIKGLAKTFRIKRTYIDFKPIVSDIGGFFKPKVKLNEKVLKGDKLGSLLNIFSEEIWEFEAPEDGLIVALKTKPIVKPGDYIMVLGKEYIKGKYWPP